MANEDKPSFQKVEVKQADSDEYVMIVITCPNRPTVTLDLMDAHGRRTLSWRIDGMGHGGILVDTKELGPDGDRMPLFCTYCGEKINLVSSKSHKCRNEFDK